MRARTPPLDRRPRRVLLDEVHPASRLPAAGLGHDRPGRGLRGEQHVVFVPTDDATQRGPQPFAVQLALRLEGSDGRPPPPWALIASSPFPGRLRAALGPAVAAALVLHRDLDLTVLPLHALEPRLSELLPPGPAPGAA